MLSRFLSIILSLTFAFPAIGAQGPAMNSEEVTLDFKVNDKMTGKKAADVRVSTKVVTLDAAKELIADAGSKNIDSTVISADQKEILETAAEASAKNKGKVFILPFGKAVVTNNNVKLEGLNEHLAKVTDQKENKLDHIGIMILTYSFAMETVMWLHADNLSSFERTSNVMYSLATALAFGVNKDSWAKTTRPIQKGIRKVLGMSTVIPNEPSHSDTAVKFASSLALSTALNLGRVPLLSMDKLAQNTFEVSGLTTPLLVAAVSTLGSFAWSEWVASIDGEAQPKAKFVTRRLLEGRSFVLGTFAATAMLMNYEKFGLAPWLAITAVGASGLAAYYNSAKISDWIENQPIFNKIQDTYKKFRKIRGPGLYICRDVLKL